MKSLYSTIILFALSGLSASTSVGEEYEGAEILEALQRTANALQHSDVVCKSTVERVVQGKTESRVQHDVRIFRSGDLLDIEDRQSLVESGFARHRWTAGPEFLVTYSVMGKKRDEIERPPSLARVHVGSPKVEIERVKRGLKGGWFLDGRLLGKDAITSLVVATASYQSKTSALGEIVEIRRKSEDGEFTIALDVNKGFQPVSIVRVVGAGDLLLGRPLHTHAPDPLLGTQYVTLKLEASELDARRVDGVWLTDSGVFTMVETLDTGTVAKVITRTERVSIELSPEFPKEAFQPDLPVGTSVDFVDARDDNKGYVWNGSYPEPRN
ncbi:MAG: hypothetical protein AAGG48_31665 [Planctomycetota bacterium]